MSTSATISPYEPAERGSIAGDVAAGIASTAAATGKFIIDSLKHDDRQKEILERYREEQCKLTLQHRTLKAECGDLKTTSAALRPVCRTMKYSSYETFVKPAESLGFKLSPLASPHKPLEFQSELILLGEKGERLVVKKNKAGRLDVESNIGVEAIDKVNAKRSSDIVEEYQKKNCKELKVETAPNGEITFVGVETKKNPDGQAIVTAVVKSDGEVAVDVSNIKGKRCDVIIQDLARAVGGECLKASRKKEYFQVVEERGKVRV